MDRKSLYSTNLAVQAPYTPSAITYEYDTYQANDPLVHYLKSDLTYSGYDPNPNSSVQTGVHPVACEHAQVFHCCLISAKSMPAINHGAESCSQSGRIGVSQAGLR